MWETADHDPVQGIAIDSGIGWDNALLPWDSINRVKVGRDLVMLYPLGGNMIIFPRRFFEEGLVAFCRFGLRCGRKISVELNPSVHTNMQIARPDRPKKAGSCQRSSHKRERTANFGVQA
jgi:YcxB-like protein